MRSRLPGDLRADFLGSGLIHVVAISGFNITLVALAVRRMAGWLIGRYSVLPAMLALPLYAALAGGEPSVVRATLMGELILLGLAARPRYRRADGPVRGGGRDRPRRSGGAVRRWLPTLVRGHVGTGSSSRPA